MNGIDGPDVRHAALDLQGVGKDFSGLRALNEISFGVGRGEIFGIMGPNGAGKSTLINLISGFMSPDRGRIEFNGSVISGLPAFRAAHAGISRTYQNVRLFHGLSVLDTVVAGYYRTRSASVWRGIFGFGGERRERREIQNQAEALLEQVGPEIEPSSVATNLAYGDQRRVEIARALAASPELLLLDEPTAGMNDVEAERIGTLLHAIRDTGVTIILIEHNIGLVVEHCDRAAVLNFGELVTTGHPRECIEDDRVREAYFGRQADAERVETLLRLRRDPSGEGG